MLIKPRINPKAIQKSAPKCSKDESINRHYWARQGRKAHQQATSATFLWVLFRTQTLNASWKYILLRRSDGDGGVGRERLREREEEGRIYFRPVGQPRADRNLSVLHRPISCAETSRLLDSRYIYIFVAYFTKLKMMNPMSLSKLYLSFCALVCWFTYQYYIYIFTCNHFVASEREAKKGACWPAAVLQYPIGPP